MAYNDAPQVLIGFKSGEQAGHPNNVTFFEAASPMSYGLCEYWHYPVGKRGFLAKMPQIW